MSTAATAADSGVLPDYELKSDLAQYCLPSANRDDARKLAWANSVCLMFVMVACLGLRQPVFVLREVEPVPEPMTVELLPPVLPEQPPQVVQEEQIPEEQLEEFEAAPILAPVVVASPQDVNFSVPVEGYVTVAADARYVPPPPAVIPRAPPPDEIPKPPVFRAIRFGGKEFRKQPPPNYPDEFQRSRIGGTVEAMIMVGSNGIPYKVDVGRSSGSPALDRHVCDFIRREWKAEPGEGANYRIAITFAP